MACTKGYHTAVPGWAALIIVVSAAWVVMAVVARGLWRARIREHDLGTGIVRLICIVVGRVAHQLKVTGREHIPLRDGGPLIVVANHTAGIDPLLIQAVLPFEVRWMMAQDMRAPILGGFWDWAGIIFVDRHEGRGDRSVREAMRHLDAGGVLGVFPEGHIERPPEHILPFRGGIGLLVRRSGAAVLPVVIEGTPQVSTAWGALWRTSHTSIRFLPLIRYGREMHAHQIADDLRARFIAATGWPASERTPRLDHDPPLHIDMLGRYFDARTGRVYSDDEVAA